MATVHRYEVPVDEQWHDLTLTGALLHVAARRPDVVDVWAVAAALPARTRSFRVFATGEELPGAGILAHRGTALAPAGLVWHLFERNP